MGLPEILIICACALIVVGVVVARIIRKKKGKCSCDCGGDCCHCQACKTIDEKNDHKQ